MVSRGYRPEGLVVWLFRLPIEDAWKRSLAALAAFEESRTPCVTHLTLAPPLLTPAVAAAATRAAPNLARLDLAPIAPPFHSAWDLSDIPGLPQVLRSFHSTLRKVSIPVRHGFPPGAVEALRGCSALEELSLVFVGRLRPGNVVAAVAELPALTQLRSLGLCPTFGAGYPSSSSTVELGSGPLPPTALVGLSALTRLTRLSIFMSTDAADISPVIANLRSLRDLNTCGPLHAEHLAGLTNLTRLHADRILVPEGPPPARHSAASGAAAGSSRALQPGPSANRWPLPPRLYKLWVENQQPLAHLARLAAPESLLRVRLEPEDKYVDSMVNQITFTGRDTNGGHALTQEVVAAFPGAVGLMKGRLRSEALLIKYIGEECLRPADPRVGHGPWLAALAPLVLRELWLEGMALDVGDMYTIAERLTTLEELSLAQCAFPASALTLLARLPRLAGLDINEAAWREEPVGLLEAVSAIAALLLSARGLQRLAVTGQIDAVSAWMRSYVRGQLARAGRSARGVRIGGEEIE